MLILILSLLLFSQPEIVSFQGPNGEELVFTLDDEGNIIEETLLIEGHIIHQSEWNPHVTEEPSHFVTLSSAAAIHTEEVSTQDNSFFSFFNYFWERGKEITRIQKETIEKAAQQLWGEFRLHLLGFYPETNERTTVGKGEVSDRVRVTAINGILNQKKDWLELIQCISQSHGNVNVHSVYWPSEGWTKDVYKGLMANSGHLSDAVKDLVLLWRSLIEEMGGIESDCLIIHYAHSIGAVETNVAKQLLTPAEMQKIKVSTFGTPHLYPNTEYLDVTHYISQRDGVIFLKPLAYFAAITDPNYKIVLIGDESGPPLIDHFINYGTYHDKILDLGAEFEAQYGTVPPPYTCQ